jgi:hypothetical protein
MDPPPRAAFVSYFMKFLVMLLENGAVDAWLFVSRTSGVVPQLELF